MDKDRIKHFTEATLKELAELYKTPGLTKEQRVLVKDIMFMRTYSASTAQLARVIYRGKRAKVLDWAYEHFSRIPLLGLCTR